MEQLLKRKLQHVLTNFVSEKEVSGFQDDKIFTTVRFLYPQGMDANSTTVKFFDTPGNLKYPQLCILHNHRAERYVG